MKLGFGVDRFSFGFSLFGLGSCIPVFTVGFVGLCLCLLWQVLWVWDCGGFCLCIEACGWGCVYGSMVSRLLTCGFWIFGLMFVLICFLMLFMLLCWVLLGGVVLICWFRLD